MCPNDESLSHVKKRGKWYEQIRSRKGFRKKHILDEFLALRKEASGNYKRMTPISFVHG